MTDLFTWIQTNDVTGSISRSLQSATRIPQDRLLSQLSLTRSQRQKVKDNIKAIQLLKQLRTAHRLPTIDEQIQLCLHLGSGLSADLFVDPPKSEWAKLATELKALLTPEEFAQMRGTMTTAYYTPPAIAQCIYEGLIRLGCNGGEWLEPTVGTGLFIGLAPSDWSCRWTGVEIDSISGSICQRLYPEATVYLQALERTRLAVNHFDGCIGNVPYSEVTPYDPQFVNWSLDGLHNYCLARSIQAVRPGGIIAVLTSVGTLQSKRSQAFRERISSLVRLLGAFKLPMTAFRSFSHTDAPADLLFFQTLAPGEDGNAEEWIDLVESSILNPETQEPLLLNHYFHTHPNHLLGELAIDKLYASPRLSLQPIHPNLPEVLSYALRDLPENVYRSRPLHVALSSSPRDSLPIPPDLQASVKPFAYVWYRDQPYQCRDGQLRRVAVKGMKRRRLWWLIQIRDAVRQVLNIQWESDDDRELEQAQIILNQRYDEFITQYGWLHSQGNELAFGDDPEYPLLLALEVWNPDRPEETEKADLFFKRTLVRVPAIDEVKTATEALVHSLADRGAVDLAYMSELYRKSEADIVSELQKSETTPLIFRDPDLDSWIIAEEYLSGNVRLKLEQAATAAQESLAYLVNVEALKQVQPKPLKAGQIYARLGSPWIPVEVIEDFIREALGIQEASSSKLLRVTHSIHSAHWKIEYRGANSTLISSQYGTSRVSAIRLIELALNQKLPAVYDTIDKDTRVKNRDETRRALLKQERLKELFKRWIWQDWKRATELVEIYNRDFNCLRRRQYDGTHLKGKLQGVSATWLDRLYNPKRAYQLNAIWRIMSSGNTLIQYPTGSGKTAIAIVAAQEMRHHHQCTKPALVVKDHLVLQQAAEAAQIYPGLRILTISTRDLDSAKKRQELVSLAATGEWDFIVMSQTAFKMLRLRTETIDSIIANETERVRSEDGKRKRSGKRAAKQLEKKVDRTEEKIREHIDSVQRDNTVYWEDLGIDLLLVDESQDYLGLATETQMQGVLGISSSNSDRASDLYYKTQYLAQLHGRDKGLVLLTATPIQNTLGQSWVNLVYLCPQVLKARGIRHFDSFISTFAEPKVSAEITAATTLEIKTRLSSWSNLPEFRELWLLVADIVTESQLDIEKPRPNYQTAEIPATAAQLKFFDYIAARAKKLQGRRSKTDNYPLITTHVKQGVIDLRCLPSSVLRQFLDDVEIATLANEHSKLEQFIEDTYQTWVETQTERCTQLLFVDIGHGFIHPYLKRRLIDRGIPEHELAFAQDATTDEQKAQLFRRVRQGDVRILCGSTPTIGAGTQIPDRLKVLRHLDCPLRPTDRWQRDGRILRPGNMHSEVEIVSYITTGKPYQNEENKQIQGLSPDSYLYEVNVRKARFIEEGLYQTDETVRTIEDIDETTLDFSLLMATATGDRRLLEKVELDNQIQKLLIEEQDWQGTQIAIAQQLDQLPHQIASVQQALNGYQHDVQTLIPTQGEAFQLMLNGSQIPYTKRSEAAQALHDIAADLTQSRRAAKRAIGSFAGFELWIEHEPIFQSTILRLQGERSYETEVRETAKGTLQALEHCPDQITRAIQTCHQTLQMLTAELEQIHPLFGQSFEKADALKAALERQEQLNEALGLMTEAQMDAVALAA
ncbi:DEAD/DEAH box helicase [Leptolyngbya sp. GGD]|uniref:DEAD/DEAH box helicase n=1 Tax=Leptolyngbya sp. GGD TaxID=2997907 RepID=UPI00227A9A86|nr:DEAD/DEAH box helicase [Leptolyngbya sp. GGD]MCY6493963.1 DEAD/DEAH box helicase [Leptolyngbya sp. GGD]